jgi:tetrahydromethanopterin S-methyltransferase subunit G
MSTRNVTNDTLYNLISDRLDRIENKVDTLQGKVNDNEVKQSITATKLVMLISGISIITSAVITMALGKLVK